MKEFFARLSRGTIAFLAIAVATLFIVTNDPPHGLCHSENDQFLKVQKPFMKPNADLLKAFKKAKAPSERLYNRCKESDNSGGCLEYFIKLKKYVSDYNVISLECKKTAIKGKNTKKIFTQSLELLVNIAWGDQDEETQKLSKYSWLDQSDLNLYCRLKEEYQKSLSESAWENYREKLMANLAGAENLSREQLWKNSLLSIPCKKVL